MAREVVDDVVDIYSGLRGGCEWQERFGKEKSRSASGCHDHTSSLRCHQGHASTTPANSQSVFEGKELATNT